MPWFTAHAVMVVRFKDSTQAEFPIWENILLIEAADRASAAHLAAARAHEDEGDSEGTFLWNGHRATWVFAGIRRLVEVSHRGAGLGSGDELSYSEYSVSTEDELDALARGKSVLVRLSE